MRKRDKQKVVEYVSVFICTQGIPGINFRNLECEFITPDGAFCSIGSLMSLDECALFSNEFIASEIGDIVLSSGNEWNRADIEFLEDLNICHDEAVRHALFECSGDPGIDDTGVKFVHEFYEKFSTLMEEMCDDHGIRFPEEYM